MSLTTILSEIWRFIKDRKVKILVGALIISILAILSGLFLPRLMDQTTEDQEIINEEQTTTTTPDEDAQESREYLTHIYEQEPATFEFFIQLEDGNVFGNSFIFDEYFTSPAVVEEIENQTGVEYSQTIDHEMNLELYKTSQYRGSIAGIRDSSSNVITIRVQAAESSEDNLALSEAFSDIIVDNEIPFIEGLKVTNLSEPSIGESLLEDDLQMVSSPVALGTFAPSESGNTSVFLYGIAGFIVGLLVTAIILFIIQLFNNKITYAFQYSWDFSDQHFLYTKDIESKQLTEFLLAPEVTNQIIVHQESPFVKQLIDNNQQIKNTTALPRFAQNKVELDEIVLFVESNVTDKEWYNEQYRLAEMYNTQITIIQAIN